MKKTVVALLFLWTAAMFSACAENDPVPEPANAKITLHFRHFWINEHDRVIQHIMQDVINRFEREHANVKVNFEGMNQKLHREQKLKSEMVTGDPPDMFELFGGAEIEPYVRAERLMDLTPFLREHGLLNRFKNLDLWTFDGKVYGLPLEGHAEPLYYNRDLFDQYGLTPPQTYEQLMHAVETFRENGIVPFALGNEDRWQGAVYYHYFLHRTAGPEVIEEITQGRGQFDHPLYLDATRKFVRFVESGALSEHPNDTPGTLAVDLFRQEQAAMYLNGSWDMNLFMDDHAPSGFKEKVGVANFPSFRSPVAGADGLAGGYTLGIGLSADLKGAKKTAALELLKDIYSPQVQSRIVYEGLRIPSMDIAIDEEKTGPIFTQVTRLIERQEHMFIPYDNVLPPEITQTFYTAVRDLLDAKMTPEEALQHMQEAYEHYRGARSSEFLPEED